MNRAARRTLAAILLVGPAVVLAVVFVLAPKAETPRDESVPEGNLTMLAFAVVEPGDESHPASGNVTLYWTDDGHLLFFRGYEARAGPNVWFHLVASGAAASESEVEGDGVRLRVPGPGQATYRGDFSVPVPEGVDVGAFGAVVAWERTLNERFAVAAWR